MRFMTGDIWRLNFMDYFTGSEKSPPAKADGPYASMYAVILVAIPHRLRQVG
jgi:hypothetical protein